MSPTDKEYEFAFNDPENQRQMRRASYKYRGVLDESDISSCQSVGLWRALNKFRPEKGNSFKNSLYRFVIWECQSALRTNRRGRHEAIHQDFDTYHTSPANSERSSSCFELLEILPEDQKTFILEKYLSRLTIKEIAVSNNMCKRDVRELHRMARENLAFSEQIGV